MMPMTRQEIEILLDSPDQRNYVVSAYADMSVKNGFARDVELHLRNQAKAAAQLLAETRARKDLEANIDVIHQIIAEHAGTTARGLAIFSSLPRGLRHVVPLDFEVENRLVIDEEPYLLPLLERWYGDPAYLIVLLDSAEAHLFTAHRGHPEWVRDLERKDADEPIQRDKPRLTFKKRFAHTQHERLRGPEDDRFLHEVAQVVQQHWSEGEFAGLILLGQAPITSSVRRLLPREIEQSIAGEAAHPMTARPEDLTDDVARAIERWRNEREESLLSELRERWKQQHLVANGPSEVLDALQQGRAARIVVGSRRDLPGARCGSCGYRFGEPLESCLYCQGRCKTVNAVQEILRMAVRHRVPVHLFREGLRDDPIAPAGGVSALLRAEANWSRAQSKTEPSASS